MHIISIHSFISGLVVYLVANGLELLRYSMMVGTYVCMTLLYGTSTYHHPLEHHTYTSSYGSIFYGVGYLWHCSPSSFRWTSLTVEEACLVLSCSPSCINGIPSFSSYGLCQALVGKVSSFSLVGLVVSFMSFLWDDRYSSSMVGINVYQYYSCPCPLMFMCNQTCDTRYRSSPSSLIFWQV